MTLEEIRRRVRLIRDDVGAVLDRYPDGTVIATTDGAVVPLDVGAVARAARELDDLERDLHLEVGP